MSILSDQNVEFITKRINESKIESAEMREDLIDHFCCVIEEEMKNGKLFEESFEKAYNDICHDGFEELQNETVFLLTTKKINAMKKVLYLSGYLSVFGLTTLAFIKLSHLPGAKIVALITTSLLVFLFLPTLFLRLYSKHLSKTFLNKFMYIFGYLGLLFLLIFLIFKEFHLPGSLIIFLTLIIVFNFLFFPLFFLKIYRKSKL